MHCPTVTISGYLLSPLEPNGNGLPWKKKQRFTPPEAKPGFYSTSENKKNNLLFLKNFVIGQVRGGGGG